MIVVAFLVPLAVYCLVLGVVNRRRHPLMVSAAWDFAGLLFAASGFLAFGLPGVLSGFSEHGRTTAMFGRPASGTGAWSWLGGLFEGLCSTIFNAGHAAVMIGYFVVVVAGSAYVLWRRQAQTAVYNVYPDVLDEVLAGVLDAAGLSWSRAGNRYFIARPDKGRPPAEDAAPPVPQRRGAYPASAEDFERSAYLEVEPVPLLCHATLRWQTEDADLRSLVEGELRTALAQVRTDDNPTATWLLTAGTVLLLAAVMIFGMVVVQKLFFER
ncbi:MAG TPA: hypothetical protein VFW33_00275 [Gemmataceae bacterium]|nr:hypothetical protein [Gemmataceae bacterium]